MERLTPAGLGLVCPDCRHPLEPGTFADAEALLCGPCSTIVPVVADLVLFTERDAAGAHLERRVAELVATLTDDARYERYLEAKLERGMLEPYAAFQPFNESVRVIDPFVADAARSLRNDDLVADLWSRTGWTAYRLAAAFPEHRTAALWDGDDGALGYAGQAYWFGPARRPDNLVAILIEPSAALPFPDDSVGIAHGHDILHRRRASSWLAGLERALHGEGTLLLPHVHLSDAEPDPFFERGGTYRSSDDYEGWFAGRERWRSRHVRVLSESFAFAADSAFTLDEAAEAPGYNGFVVGTAAAADKRFSPAIASESPVTGDERLISNPLVSVCPFTARVTLGGGAFVEHVADMMLRHPVYETRLKNVLPERLSTGTLRLLATTSRGETLNEAALALDLPSDEVAAAALALQGAEVVRIVDVSPAAVELQAAHGNRATTLGIAAAWQAMGEAAPVETLFEIDGERLDTDELRTLVDGWRHWLRARPADEAIAFGTRPTGPEIPVAIAAWLEGRATVSDAPDGTLRLTAGKPLDLAGSGMDDYWEAVAPHLDGPALASNDQERCTLVRTASRLRWLSGLAPVPTTF